MPQQSADVAIHCGDLTEESKLSEFRAVLQLLHAIKAPRKLIIAGNHDFTLDEPTFRSKIQDSHSLLEPELVEREYGAFGEAKRLLLDAKKQGIHLLDEGTHYFTLQNGAALKVFASPYAPSLGDWGFQYHPDHGHKFAVENGTDIVITHGPPRGIFDRTNSRERAGCPDLFAAVARSRPRMHCFGHIHEGWGAKLVAWRDSLDDKPSHLTAIDNSNSILVETLSTLRKNGFDPPEILAAKEAKVMKFIEQRHCGTSLCSGEEHALTAGKHTLFVNAAIKGEDALVQFPWIVELELPKADRVEQEEPKVPGQKDDSDMELERQASPQRKQIREAHYAGREESDCLPRLKRQRLG